MGVISNKSYVIGSYRYYFNCCCENKFKFHECNLLGGVARVKEFSLDELKELVPKYTGFEQKTEKSKKRSIF